MEFLFLLLLIGGVIWFFFIHKTADQRASIQQRLEVTSAPIAAAEDDEKWKYKHQFKDTAIALAPAERLIRLRSMFVNQIAQKEYSYSDVRSWDFNISTGGHVRLIGNAGVNAQVGAGLANYMQNKKNEAESGLFITVRDIDYPEWQIKFPPDKGRELELKRWMEILRQEINLD